MPSPQSPESSGRLRNHWKLFVCVVIGLLMAVVFVGTARQHPSMDFAPTMWTLLLSATGLAGCVLGITSELKGRLRPAAWQSTVVNPWKLVVCGYLLIAGIRGLINPSHGPLLPANQFELAGGVLVGVAECLIGAWGLVGEARKLRAK